MRVTIAAVGRPKDEALAAAIRDFETRAARYWPLEIAEVKSERAEPGTPIPVVKAREAERIAARAGNAAIVACDVGGRVMSSEQFAAWLQSQRESATDIAFAIGGAFGLDDALVARARLRLSLASWTMSHDLARLVLAEQLYRAGTIVRGEPYHK